MQASDRGSSGHLAELLRAFHIGPDDLAANRSGRLSARQVRRLQRSVVWNLVGVVVMIAGIVAILLLVAERPLRPVQVILSAVLVLAAAIMGIVHVARLREDVHDDAVICLAGPARVRMQGRAGWYLYVANRRFRMPVQFWHLPVEAPYRVYVAPRASRIVAMEPDGWG